MIPGIQVYSNRVAIPFGFGFSAVCCANVVDGCKYLQGCTLLYNTEENRRTRTKVQKIGCKYFCLCIPQIKCGIHLLGS